VSDALSSSECTFVPVISVRNGGRGETGVKIREEKLLKKEVKRKGEKRQENDMKET
jgi:hypothetical protein